MLTPRDLLNLAEQLAARLPLDAGYEEERNACWNAIGESWLKLGDTSRAVRALGNLNEPQRQAELRHAICLWLGENPGDGAARAVVRDTLSRIGYWEEWLSRRDVSEMAAVVNREFGEDTVRQLAAQLLDPFTSGNVLVTLASSQDPRLRLDTLREAETIASTVREGDRDYALRWVFNGYLAAGSPVDAARVSESMTDKLEHMKAQEAEIEQFGERIAEFFKQPDEPAETLRARVDRILGYRFNDLKVKLLTDLAQSGDVIDEELERLVIGDRFSQVEPPRPRRICRTPPMTDDAFAQFFFDRPVPSIEADKDLLEGEGPDEECDDPAKFVACITSLFRRFGEIGARHTPHQVDQGLWYLLGYQFSFIDVLFSQDVALNGRQDCVRAMFYPFRDYYALAHGDFPGTLFYMWWELVLRGVGQDTAAVAIETLREILELSDKECQNSALHGLNHLHPNPEAADLVSRYLEANRGRMNAEEIGWVEACRDGKAQ